MKQKTKGFGSELLLFVWAMIVLLPLLWIVFVSLKTNNEFFMDPWGLPKEFQFSNYAEAWTKLKVGPAFLNTLYFVGGGLILGVLVTTLCSYVLTRLEWKGKKVVWGLLMASLFLPGINILVPQYRLMLTFHLNNSIIGLILMINMAMSAFDIMLLSGFMQSIPKELEESAIIDGASLFVIFKRIILPLSTPGIVTVSIFRFLGLYNDFLNPFIYLTDTSKHTIAVNMYYANQLMKYSSDWVTLFAAIVLSMLPVLIVYVIFQKRIVEGATIGAVKG